jgi:isopenicillin-N N-acyltransferase-like protein
MRRRTFIRQSSLGSVGLFLNPWTLTQCKKQNQPEIQTARSNPHIKKLKFFVLEGTPRERGRSHGEALKSEINEMVGGLTEMIKKAGGNPDDYASQIVNGAGFLDAAQKWTPHLVEEIKGIADGCGIDFKIMFAWNLLDEAEWFFQSNKWINPDYREKSRCSVLGVNKERSHPTIVAQNADMGPVVDGFQTLFHIKHDDSNLEELVLSLPGVTGVYGMNNRSMGVCLNALTMTLNKSPLGLATIFIARGILYQNNLDEAIQFIREVKHASGEAYTFGDKDRTVCFEGSANKVSQFIPYPKATRVYHTNHPLVNDDIWLSVDNPEKLAPAIRERLKTGIANSKTRFQTLETKLSDQTKPITVETVKSILCSHDSSEYPICRHDESGNITTFSMIMTLTDSPEMHVAAGPPCQTGYEIHKF